MSVAQKDGIKAAEGISYDDLYRRWEQRNWKATAIDFAADREGWEALSEIQRKSALWIYSMFFYGEDSVADNLSPYIDAAPTRGAEVLPRHPAGRRGPPRGLLPPLLQGGDRRRRLDRRDPRLHRAAARLGLPQRLRPARPDGRRAAPDRSLPKFAQAIALYHMVVEATLAQPGQHFIEDYFAKAGTMPGLQRGDGERLARRAAPHRLRRQGALRVLRRVRGVQGRRWSSCCAR